MSRKQSQFQNRKSQIDYVNLFLVMPKIEYNDFYNDGFGFICKHCERELKEKEAPQTHRHPRFMREGEAESKQTKLSNSALAKWLDKVQTTLICPNCGIVEKID